MSDQAGRIKALEALSYNCFGGIVFRDQRRDEVKGVIMAETNDIYHEQSEELLRVPVLITDGVSIHRFVCKAVAAALREYHIMGLKDAMKIVTAWSNNQFAESQQDRQRVLPSNGAPTIEFGGESKRHASEMLAAVAHVLQCQIDEKQSGSHPIVTPLQVGQLGRQGLA